MCFGNENDRPRQTALLAGLRAPGWKVPEATIPPFPKFDTFACVEDSVSIEVGPLTVTASLYRDEDYRIDDDDVHSERRAAYDSDETYARAMEAREAWMRDEWFYGMIVLSVSIRDHTVLGSGPALSGIEVNYPHGYRPNDYLSGFADDMVHDALIEAGDALANLFDGVEESMKHLKHIMEG